MWSAALYKRRWQIELFFRWIKQNLELKRFLAKNPNAVRLQIVTALIAFVALKLLQQASRCEVPLKISESAFPLPLFSAMVEMPPAVPVERLPRV